MRIDDLMQDGNYLPACLRDFHAQKRIFKRIDEIVQRRREKHAQDWTIGDTGLITWIDAHVYVIDFFLWYMARRGYTLQRSRQRCEFIDLESDLADFDRREAEAQRENFDKELNTSSTAVLKRIRE